MIQTFPLDGSPELMVSNILDILDATNRRIDAVEATSGAGTNAASCLANGIQPD